MDLEKEFGGAYDSLENENEYIFWRNAHAFGAFVACFVYQ